MSDTAVIVEHDGRSIRLAGEHAHFALHVARDFDTYFHCVRDAEVTRDFSQPSWWEYANGVKFFTPSVPEVISDYFRLYRPGAEDVVFDLGAYCGVTTYEFSKLAKRVFAFEPDRRNLAALRTNVLHHKLGNVSIIPEAIGRKVESRRFYGDASLGSRFARPEFERGEFYDVRAVSLRQAFAMYGIPQFIKMDIEGAEIEVLESSLDLISENRIHFAIDTNHRVAGQGYTAQEVHNIFRKCGYRVETAKDNGSWTTWASPA